MLLDQHGLSRSRSNQHPEPGSCAAASAALLCPPGYRVLGFAQFFKGGFMIPLKVSMKKLSGLGL